MRESQLSSQEVELSLKTSQLYLKSVLPSVLTILQHAVELTALRKAEVLSFGESAEDFRTRKEKIRAAAAELSKNPSREAQRAVHDAKWVNLTVAGAGLDPSTDPDVLLDLAIQRCLDWVPFDCAPDEGVSISCENLLAWEGLPDAQRSFVHRSQIGNIQVSLPVSTLAKLFLTPRFARTLRVRMRAKWRPTSPSATSVKPAAATCRSSPTSYPTN